MNIKKKIICVALLFVTALSIAVPALAVNVDGGDWTYGCNHAPLNWGAYSNFYHKGKWHWSSVQRTRDPQKIKKTATAGNTSKAFVNTNLGEYVDFACGF